MIETFLPSNVGTFVHGSAVLSIEFGAGSATITGTQTLGPDLGVVDEDVRPTLLRQKPEPLGVIEPLDGTVDHESAGLLRPMPAATSPARP